MARPPSLPSTTSTTPATPSIFTEPCRIGFGVDHHRLLDQPLNPQQKPLTLGGYALPDQHLSFESNSDGDVLIHALCNALSTAIGEGSLAPIADPLCEAGAHDSRTYLPPFLAKIKSAGYVIGNISASLEAARPKLEPHRLAITTSLAQILQLSPHQIGLAFTTGEGLTACGRGAGIYAQVTCLLLKNN